MYAPVAQGIEQFGSNEWVGGSNPSGRTSKFYLSRFNSQFKLCYNFFMATTVEIPIATDWKVEPILALVDDLNRTHNKLQNILCASVAFKFSLRAITHGQGDFRSFGEPRLVKGGFGVDGVIIP